MKTAKDYLILRGVASDYRTTIPLGCDKAPVMVGVLLDESALVETGQIVHHKTIFIDDRFHDWEYVAKDKSIRYYSHAIQAASLAETPDEVERCDIVVVFEFEPKKA